MGRVAINAEWRDSVFLAIKDRLDSKCPVCKNPKLTIVAEQHPMDPYPLVYFKCPVCGPLSINQDWLPYPMMAADVEKLR